MSTAASRRLQRRQPAVLRVLHRRRARREREFLGIYTRRDGHEFQPARPRSGPTPRAGTTTTSWPSWCCGRPSTTRSASPAASTRGTEHPGAVRRRQFPEPGRPDLSTNGGGTTSRTSHQRTMAAQRADRLHRPRRLHGLLQLDQHPGRYLSAARPLNGPDPDQRPDVSRSVTPRTSTAQLQITPIPRCSTCATTSPTACASTTRRRAGRAITRRSRWQPATGRRHRAARPSPTRTSPTPTPSKPAPTCRTRSRPWPAGSPSRRRCGSTTTTSIPIPTLLLELGGRRPQVVPPPAPMCPPRPSSARSIAHGHLFGLFPVCAGFRAPPYDNANSASPTLRRSTRSCPTPTSSPRPRTASRSALAASTRTARAGSSPASTTSTTTSSRPWWSAGRAVTQFQYVNLGHVKIWGVEARGECRFPPDWSVLGYCLRQGIDQAPACPSIRPPVAARRGCATAPSRASSPSSSAR